ncbi:MAG: DNA/RNA nuclease SfsA [Desulfitobacterium hafniense]|nr:DNA/RNA nuclease SfsA [Desulfitobacterium hafniense]
MKSGKKADYDYIHGIFLEECKNRFLCKVKINNREELCYQSSSSKLGHFIDLPGREVVLVENAGKNSKTKYTLHAVKTNSGYILLNLGYVNKLLLKEFAKPDSLYNASGQMYCEKKVADTLKADFFFDGTERTIVEAKGIISEAQVAYLPSMEVDRAVAQLSLFSNLLSDGYFVHYYVVLMNPEIETLRLDSNREEYYRLFRLCLSRGLEFFLYKVVWHQGKPALIRDSQGETVFLSNAVVNEDFMAR